MDWLLGVAVGIYFYAVERWRFYKWTKYCKKRGWTYS